MVYPLTWPTKSNPFWDAYFSVESSVQAKPAFVKVVGRLLAVVCEYDVDSYALETSGNVCTPGEECGGALLLKTRHANSVGHILYHFIYQSKILYEICVKLPKKKIPITLVKLYSWNKFFIPNVIL